jgi:uncharacterized membrane protein YgcG
MLALHKQMRAGTRRLGIGALPLLMLAACGGDDLLLPEDRTPVELRAYSGNGQAAPVGSPVPNPLVVEALDQAKQPVEGVVIAFRFLDRPNGATIAPAVSETDPEGLASAQVTLGAPAGDQTVEARLDDPSQELSVRFLLTAVPTGGGGAGDDDDPPGDGDDGGNGGDGGGDDDEGGNGGGGDDRGGGGRGDGNGGGNDDDDHEDEDDDDDDDDDDDSGRGNDDDD